MAHRIPTTWNNIEYATRTEAARAAGVTIFTLRNYLAQGYTCDDEVAHLRGRGKSKPCTWNGVKYASIAEAARANFYTGPAMLWRLQQGYTCDDDLHYGKGMSKKGQAE